MTHRYPGRPLTSEEMASMLQALGTQPVSVVILLLADGSVGVLPEFHPNEEFPDFPTLLHFMADNMVRNREVDNHARQ